MATSSIPLAPAVTCRSPGPFSPRSQRWWPAPGRPDWTDEQIVEAYRAQSKAERAFRRMKHPVFSAFSPAFHWTDQKLKVHAFSCTLALAIVHLIEREARRAGIKDGGQQILRQLSEIDELTLVYPPAGGRQGRPRVRRRIADNLDQA